jgi:hypothetical protein
MSRIEQFRRGVPSNVSYAKLSASQLSNHSRHLGTANLHRMESDRHGEMSAEAMEADRGEMMMRHADRATQHDYAAEDQYAKANKDTSVKSRPRSFQMDSFSRVQNFMNAMWQ